MLVYVQEVYFMFPTCYDPSMWVRGVHTYAYSIPVLVYMYILLLCYTVLLYMVYMVLLYVVL